MMCMLKSETDTDTDEFGLAISPLGLVIVVAGHAMDAFNWIQPYNHSPTWDILEEVKLFTKELDIICIYI